MNRLSIDEFFRGSVGTLVLTVILGWTGVSLSAVCGVLYMAGGTFNKSIRRFGIPLLILAVCSLKLGFHWYYLFGLLGIIILCQGDGFPDHRPTTEDEGSTLGKWVEKHISLNDSIGGPITKWIIPVFFQISLVPYFIN